MQGATDAVRLVLASVAGMDSAAERRGCSDDADRWLAADAVTRQRTPTLRFLRSGDTAHVWRQQIYRVTQKCKPLSQSALNRINTTTKARFFINFDYKMRTRI